MDDQAAGITDVGQVRENFHRIDHRFAGGETALDPEREDRAGAFRQVFLGQFIVRARWQAGEGDPGDLGMTIEEFSHGQGIGAMAFHTQG